MNFLFPFTVHFISIKLVFCDHLPYWTIFHLPLQGHIRQVLLYLLILFKLVLSDHLPNVTIHVFHRSLARSHKTDLTVSTNTTCMG